ncbi:hypothetical protein [Pandoraea sputorum]|uniref:Uncharacterized protein n=1 Tax=Pandoraea sputorum TaxID=93222 RepID=A0A5E5BGR2_9BURK|nr:hypothetical protein [Pandoraea sputorum]VVE85109.1 hypothetical protein PSP31121_05096 [Pandoraea sputorum]
MFPTVANESVLSFRYDWNDPVTYTDVVNIKGAETLDKLVARPDERSCLKKVWDWCCVGVEYNGVTKEADGILWHLLHAPDDPLGLFERLRDTVANGNLRQFVYLRFDRTELHFTLNGLEDNPIHFRAAPTGVPARIIANFWNMVVPEHGPGAAANNHNLASLHIYNNASAHIQNMLDRLALPQTFAEISRAFEAEAPGRASTGMAEAGMADPGMPGTGVQDPLLAVAQQYTPQFTLHPPNDNGIIRADVRYRDGLGWLDVSFLIRERFEGEDDKDTVQCIFTKYTSSFG